MARALGRRFVFSERKDGVMMIRRGFEIAQGEKVIIVEDVVTRGTSLLEVIKCVEDAGGVVTGLTSIIDRTTGDVELPLTLHALTKVAVQTFDADSCPNVLSVTARSEDDHRGLGVRPRCREQGGVGKHLATEGWQKSKIELGGIEGRLRGSSKYTVLDRGPRSREDRDTGA